MEKELLFSRNIKDLKDLKESDVQNHGLKAVRLGMLMREGFPVPSGFSIGANIINEIMNGNNYQTDSNATKYFRNQPKNGVIESLLLGLVTDKVGALINSETESVAVRSSGTDEDSEHNSFAGLYKSFLFLRTPDEIVKAIKEVWYSLWDEAAIAYREKFQDESHQNGELGMSIILQKMIIPKFSGVCFTKNPIVDDNCCLIEFNTGTAEKLLQGDKTGSRALIGRSSLRLKNSSTLRIMRKRLDLKEVARQALKIEKVFSSPQDIEWCIDQRDSIWILQTRPAVSGYSNTNSKIFNDEWELMQNEAFSTLGCELALKRHELWVKAINQFYGLHLKPRMLLKGHFILYKQPLKKMKKTGRIWVRIFDFLWFLNFRHVLNTYIRVTLPDYHQLSKKINRNYKKALSLEELADYLDQSIFIYINSQIKSFAIGRIAQTSLVIFSHYIRLGLHGDDTKDALLYVDFHNQAIERDILLEGLMAKIRQFLDLKSGDQSSLSKVMQLLNEDEEGAKLRIKLEEFIERHGYIWADRYPRDPAWEIDHKKIDFTLKEMLNGENRKKLKLSILKEKNLQEQAIKKIEKSLPYLFCGTLRLKVFKLLLSRIKCLAVYKEQRNIFLYSINMSNRKIVIEIGRRLKEKGELDLATDMFFLKHDEIRNICVGKMSIGIAKRRIKTRKRSFNRYSVKGSNVYYSGHSQFTFADLQNLQGIGCCPGIAIGSVRLITGRDSLNSVKRGEIVVCRNFRPAWSIILGRISGLVIEGANVLSHGAILAREYQVPTVVNVVGISKVLDTKDVIEINGSSGELRLIRKMGSAYDS